jgi:hypothetical protein
MFWPCRYPPPERGFGIETRCVHVVVSVTREGRGTGSAAAPSNEVTPPMLAKDLDVRSRGPRFGYINTLATPANINARNIHFTATKRNVSNMHNVDSLMASACVIPARTACWLPLRHPVVLRAR